MNLTQQRRRAFNKAVRNMFPDTTFTESSNGIPVMECSELPKGVYLVDEPVLFFKSVNEHCTHANSTGLKACDYSKALPVFIKSISLEGNNSSVIRTFYRVNYVSASKISQQKAAEYISERKLYAAIRY